VVSIILLRLVFSPKNFTICRTLAVVFYIIL